MSHLHNPFRYDYVGSFLRPENLKQARRAFDEGKIDYAKLKEVEDQAITAATRSCEDKDRTSVPRRGSNDR